jgi:uncharacterized lipoprotein YehR (DUF1307 family)
MEKKLVVSLIMLLLIITGCGKEASKEKISQESTANLPKINKVTIQKVDKDTIKVVSDAKGEKLQYAYYVYKDNKVLQKISYKPNNRLAYNVKEPGEYMVRVYIRDNKGKKAAKTTRAIKVGVE